MSKRKSDAHYEELYKKLRKIEKEIQWNKKRRHRVRTLSSSSSSSSSQEDSPARQSELNDSAPPSPDPAGSDLQQNAASLPPAPTQAESAPHQVELAPPTHESEIDATLGDVTVGLDADILEILGVDPTKTNVFGKNIQNDVAVRFEHIATTGLTKEARKELSDKYLVPENCKLISAPALNPEIKAALSEAVIKRDKIVESKQAIMASAISSLGEAITMLLSSNEKNTELLRLLMDTGRTLSDCQHNDTMTRRNFILFAVKKEMKESLQSTKVDHLLFGQQLPDTLKAAKAISKSGADLKAPPPPKPSTSKRSMQSKNWKSSNPARKNTVAKAKEVASSTTRTPAASTRNLRPNSYRPSQTHRSAHNRR